MSLDRSTILAAAMGILDDYGLGDLTMRRLADSLNVKAGALYWHYANKQTLLAAVSDDILAPVVDAGEGDVAARLDVWSNDLRDALLRHRDAADVVSSTRAAGLGSIDPASVPTQILTSAGTAQLGAEQTARALVHFVLGHVVEEQSRTQLVELGVLPEGTEALDGPGFTHGLAIFLRGLGG